MDEKNKQSTPNLPQTTPTQVAVAILSDVFNGQLFPGAVTRVYSTDDPANEGRKITTRKRFDLITNMQLTRVSGLGRTENLDQAYITINGVYAPGKSARITALAQNVGPVAAMLKEHGKVDKTNPDMPLTQPVTVEVVCTEMTGRSRGYTIEEIYLVAKDGKKTPVIGPQNGSIEASAVATDLF